MIRRFFKSKAERNDKNNGIAPLIALAKTMADPKALDEAMRAASDRAPFWPNDPALTQFLAASKNDAALDAHLMAAAAHSAPLRSEELAKGRKADREGAFTHFIYVDEKHPLDSAIFKIIRAPHTGGGTGAWGGLREKDDADIASSVNREIYEEVIDALRLVLKTGNADAKESELDKQLNEAALAGKPLSEGVAHFIDSLKDQPALQREAATFAAQANELISELIAAPKQQLFKCQDNAHVITRGWGFAIDAYAHVASIPKDTADKFSRLCARVDLLKKMAQDKGISTAAGEMQGIATYSFAQAPFKARDSHYGHEAYAEITGFARLLAGHLGNRGLRDFWDNCDQSGLIGACALKMRLHVEDLQKHYVTLARSENKTYVDTALNARSLSAGAHKSAFVSSSGR